MPLLTGVVIVSIWSAAQGLPISNQVRTASGIVEGRTSADAKVRIFEGIPYAAPPLGELRWKPPQPAVPWKGVRKAGNFGARCMQGNIFPDMVFRDAGPNEDCLYLNVWTPAQEAGAKLPVMVWIYGGGFAAGASSEPRQDGEHLAEKGVVVVSFNYRLGVFGFFAHPALAKESGRDAAGNYGLLDQVAALHWVQQNIGGFGGNPDNVTIFGESAGSFSVSALMASPLTPGLFEKAIGESGAFFGPSLATKTLRGSEQAGEEFADSIGASSLSALRAKPANELLEVALKRGAMRFGPNIDGYFLPEDVHSIYAAGKQRHVPLLAGWNADEGSYHSIFEKNEATPQNYAARLRSLYGNKSDELLRLYPARDDEQTKRSAQDLAGDSFIGYSTWKWIEMQSTTGASPVYRYRFEDAPPGEDPSRGAYHSAEIEFVFGNLDAKHLPWRPADRKLSELMSSYWTNFAKVGSLSSGSLPAWPVYARADHYQVMHLDADPRAAADKNRSRYEFLDTLPAFKPNGK